MNSDVRANNRETTCEQIGTGLVPSSTPACCQRSCKGICGRNNAIVESFEWKCNCDIKCIVFGDCCHDYYSVCLSWNNDDIIDERKSSDIIQKQLQRFKNQKEKEMTVKLFQHKQCVPVGTSNYYWMISSCPRGSTASDSRLCENKNPKMFGSIPVSHKRFNHIAFRNMHCAKCNGLASNDVVIWSSSAKCSSTINKESLNNLEELSKLFKNETCSMISNPQLGRPRSCFEEDTKDRHFGLIFNKTNSSLALSVEQNSTLTLSNQQNSSVAQICYLCKAYHYRIVVNSSVTFRNPHCVQCLLGDVLENRTDALQCQVGSFYYGETLPRCGPDYSCKNRCIRDGIMDSYPSVCQCDFMCVIFGDCCFDYYSECLNSTLTETVNNGTLDRISTITSISRRDPQYTPIQYLLQYRNYLQCVEYNKLRSVWMISQCPSSYENQTIIRKCFDAEFENIPFSHKRVNYITFRNKYCAQCHNISVDDLHPWLSTVRCELFAPNPLSSYEAFVESLLNKCTISASLYFKSEMIRTCIPHIPEDKQSTLCSFYQYPLNEQGGVSKNPHCSVHYNAEYAQCYETSHKDSSMETLTSLSILFNFDSGRGGVSLRVTQGGTDTVLKPRTIVCGVSEVYDLLLESCTRLVCPAGKIPINGSCVIQGMYIIDKHTQLLPNGSQFVYIGMDVDSWNDIDVLRIWVYIKYKHTNETLHLSDKYLYKENIKKNRNIVLDENIFLNRIFRLNVDIIDTLDPFSIFAHQNISDILQNDILSIRLSTDSESFISRISSLQRNTVLMGDLYIKMLFKYLTVTNYKDEDNLTCIKGHQKRFMNPTFSVVDGTYYGNISNIYFQLNSVPFELAFNVSYPELNLISIVTCEVSLQCNAVSYNKSEFEVHNNTLYIMNSEIAIDSDHFVLLGDTALVCSNFTNDYTYFEKVEFFNFNSTQEIVTLVTALISMVCLALTLVVYLMLSELRNVPGKLIMSLSLMLLVSQCLLLTIHLPTGRMCMVFAAITHACWLSTFAWMTVIGVNLAITFRVNASGSNALISENLYTRYAVFAWGFPLVIVLSSVGVDLANIPDLSIGYGDGDICWISNNTASLIVFGVPIAALLSINIVCFLVTLYGIRKAIEISKNISSTRKDRQTFSIYSKLFMITGLSWCFCFVAAFVNIEALWYAFIVTNNLQGLYVFIGFACTSRVFDLLKQKYFPPEPEFSNTTPSTHVSYSSQTIRH